MSTKKTYAVFGLGRYGSAVANELVKSGAEVIAVDISEAAVNNAATTIPVCKCADITDKEVIKQLGISNVDVVIIAMASHLEANVMAIMLCKELGVPVCDCYEVWRSLYAGGMRVTEHLSNKINHPTREMNRIFAYELIRTIFTCDAGECKEK